jgi:hypothetical protein
MLQVGVQIVEAGGFTTVRYHGEGWGQDDDVTVMSAVQTTTKDNIFVKTRQLLGDQRATMHGSRSRIPGSLNS